MSDNVALIAKLRELKFQVPHEGRGRSSYLDILLPFLRGSSVPGGPCPRAPCLCPNNYPASPVPRGGTGWLAYDRNRSLPGRHFAGRISIPHYYQPQSLAQLQPRAAVTAPYVSPGTTEGPSVHSIPAERSPRRHQRGTGRTRSPGNFAAGSTLAPAPTLQRAAGSSTLAVPAASQAIRPRIARARARLHQPRFRARTD